MLNKVIAFVIWLRGTSRTFVNKLRLRKVHKPRFVNSFRFDYEFSIILLVAGLVGAAINLVPVGISTGTKELPIVQPVEDVVASSASPLSLSPSIPTLLEIPVIGVKTNLVTLGKNTDGTLETPTEYNVAGWYKYSPTPGEMGPAIITGHVDNYLGPAVFYNLKDLVKGNGIKITREDGSIANFVVDHVEVFDQDAFPTQEVYGNIDHSGLRLITCGGNYSVMSGRYSHNVVVYATYSNP